MSAAIHRLRILRRVGCRSFLIWAALLPLTVGCATSRPTTPLEMEDITIVGDRESRRGDYYDSYELFARADKAFVDADWETAAGHYRRLLEEYPASEVVPLARFNLGLVYERTARWQEALTVYQSFPLPPGKGVRLDEIRMRQGVCLQRLERHEQAREIFSQVLNQAGVPALEYNEARVRSGISAYRLGHEGIAKRYLDLALTEYENNARRGVHHGRAAYAQGYFIRGEIAFREFRDIEVFGTGEMLNRLLHQKANAFLAAKDIYTMAIRTYEPEWMLAAMHRIGEGYEIFYQAVMALPEPEELEPEGRDEYRRMLAEKMRPVLDKAITAYRLNLELSQDQQLDNEWVSLSRRRYQELTDGSPVTP